MKCPYCNKNRISNDAKIEMLSLARKYKYSWCFNPGGAQFNFNFGRIQICAECDECDLISFKQQMKELNKL